MVRVDVWDLDVPRNVPTVVAGVRYPANAAVEIPIKDFGLMRAEGYTEGEGRFTYGLLYRFSGKAAKHQLPVSSVENLICFLSEYAIANPAALWDGILHLEVDNVANPVSINRVEGEDQDWLIVGRLEMKIKFVADSMSGDGQYFDVLQPAVLTEPTPPIAITEIRTGLFRATFPVKPGDPSTYIKDQELVLSTELDGLGEGDLLGDGNDILGDG